MKERREKVEEKMSKQKEFEIDIEKFILFHKRRVSLLRKLVKEKIHGRLIFQISFLGIESLAKLLYPEENSTRKRFLELLSKEISKSEAEFLWYIWRCPLIHGGFVEEWTLLEALGEEDISFIKYNMNQLRCGWEFSPETIISIYENLIEDVIDIKRKN